MRVEWSAYRKCAAALSIGALLISAGCVETTRTETPLGVAAVEVAPSFLSITVGGQGQLVATPRSGSGKSLTARLVQWSSTNLAVAVVNASGVVTGVAAGSATITASSEGHSTSAAVSVTQASAISITLSPNAVSVQQGASANATVFISRTNYTSAVSVAASGMPAGVTINLNPATTTGSSSTATVTVSAATAVGAYSITFTASGAGVSSAIASLILTVQQAAPPGDFTLSTAPASLTIAAGSSGMSVATIVRTNFTTDVALSLSNLPAGMTGTFASATLSGPSLSTTMTISVASSVAPGNYLLTVRGVGGALTRTTTLTVAVVTPNVSFSASPPSLSVQRGQSGTSTLNIARTAFIGGITPTVIGNPTGMTVTFSPAAPISGNSSTMTVTVGASVAAGTYSVVIAASGVPGNPSVVLPVTVTTGSPAPVVSTDLADQITTTSARINGSVVQDGQPYTVWFEFGTSPTLSVFTQTGPGTGPNTSCPGTSTCLWESILPLNRGTTYYFRIAASNAGGTTRGIIRSFTTLP